PKSVDANLRARAGELVDGVFKLIRVVRQLRDLFLSQHVAERRAIRIRVSYLRFFFDVDIDLDWVDLECDFLLMLSGGEIEIDVLRFESRRFDAQLIATNRQLVEPHFAALVGRVERLRLSVSY